MASTQCPVCLGGTEPYDLNTSGVVQIRCVICGEFFTSYELATDARRLSPEERAHLSGWIRDRWRRGEKDITVLSQDITPILKDVRRMSPAEKANHLLATISRVSGRPGVEIPSATIRHSDAWASDPAELGVYIRWLLDRKLILQPQGRPLSSLCLTLDGWAEADRLEKQRTVNATLAFMAMPFGNDRLDRIVKDCFVPAAKATGYDLRRLNEGQPAGLIDDQLRVRLRTARFVVSDLTDGNQGAYWEAGFAEGLGTPVIYSCEESVFNSPERKKGTHFDTNHLVTVLWKESNLPAAAEELKAHIRATLPTEAKLED